MTSAGISTVDWRQIDRAEVWKGDCLAGWIARTEAGIEFTYDPVYLAQGGGEVATTLPLSSEPVLAAGGGISPFFAGLLPEGRRLTALRRAVRTSAEDDFTLLLAVGADLVGDVRVLPVGAGGSEPAATFQWTSSLNRRKKFSFRELADSAGVIDRHGIAGVQDKVSAAMITLPTTAAGRASILKLNPPEFPNLVENEAFFLRLARRAKFRVPKFELIPDSTGESGLLVQRFDRDYRDGVMSRLAVEDATQIANFYPSKKYLISSETVAHLLIGHCIAKKAAALNVFRMFVFAWLTGNGDLHAKNISILHRAGEWSISPVYDIPSSLPYPVDADMALTLSGRDYDLSLRAFREFADAIGLPVAAAERAVDELLRATAGLADEWAAAEHPFMRPRNHEAVQQLRHRRRLLEGVS